MSPRFNVEFEIYKKEGVLDPVANTLNNVRGQIFNEVFGEAADDISIEFEKVGRAVSFVLECDTIEDATDQANSMKHLDVISNPVIEDVTIKVTENIEDY